MPEQDPRTYAIIGAAMEVHKQLGCGFLEAVYQEALALEFTLQDIPHQREVALPVFYKEQRLQTTYRADFICYDEVVVADKSAFATQWHRKSPDPQLSKSDRHRNWSLAQFWGRIARVQTFYPYEKICVICEICGLEAQHEER